MIKKENEMSKKLFPAPNRTYKTFKNAKKVVDGLIEGNYKWLIACTENGRFFPVIFYSNKECQELNHFYFIEKGCCVQVS